MYVSPEDLIAKYGDCPYVVFSDFDGTITTEDTNDYLIDNYGMGKATRKELWSKVVTGEDCFRDAFHVSLESITKKGAGLKFPEAIKILQSKISLDPKFLEFYEFCKSHSPPIPVIVVSSGMQPIIRGVLGKLIGEEEASKIDIVSNDVKIDEETGYWQIVYRHPESGFGHDKSRCIVPFRDLPHRPTLFFCGDGISDLSAARHADLLFARTFAPPAEDSDLVKYCQKEGLGYRGFSTFATVKEDLASVVDAGKNPSELMSRQGHKIDVETRNVH